MANVLVFGSGAIGSCYVYLLERAGCNVTAVCRSNYEQVRRDGVSIDSGVWGRVSARPDVVGSIAEAAGLCAAWDFVVVATKAFPGSTPSAAETIKAVVAANTAIVLLQNGIAIEDEYRQLYPDRPILSGAVYLAATQLPSGVVRTGPFELLEVGTFPSDAPASHKEAESRFAGLITKGGGSVTCWPDIQSRRWAKLLLNASWNPICAISLCSDVDYMAATPQGTDMVFDVMLELVAIANACGYTELGEHEARSQLARATVRMPDKGIEPSMLADIRNDKPMEVEAIVGNAVRLAEAKGVRAPCLTMIYCLTKALDQSNARRRNQR